MGSAYRRGMLRHTTTLATFLIFSLAPAYVQAQTVVVIEEGGHLASPLQADPANHQDSERPPLARSTPAAPASATRLQLPEPRLGFGARISLELLGGVVGAGTAVGIGAGLLSSGCAEPEVYPGAPYDDEYAYDDSYQGLLYGCGWMSLAGLSLAGAMAPFSTTFGIWSFGRAAGGHGNYWMTMLGTLAGGGLGAVVTHYGATAAQSDATALLAVSATPLLMIAGGVLAFELDHARRLRRSQASAPSVVPTFSASADGANLGVAGIF